MESGKELVTLNDFYDICVVCIQSRYGIEKPKTANAMGMLITDTVYELCCIKLFKSHASNSLSIIRKLKMIYCYDFKEKVEVEQKG